MAERRPFEFGDDRLPQKFWDKVQPEPMSGCWLWVGAQSTGRGLSYGSFGYRFPGGRSSPKRAHRVAYFACFGTLPPRGCHVDHICRVTLCVNPSHLRPATVSENQAYSRARHRTSRFKGVSRTEGQARPWRAKFYFGGRAFELGRFATEEEAAVAYDKTAERVAGSFALTNKGLGLL